MPYRWRRRGAGVKRLVLLEFPDLEAPQRFYATSRPSIRKRSESERARPASTWSRQRGGLSEAARMQHLGNVSVRARSRREGSTPRNPGRAATVGSGAQDQRPGVLCCQREKPPRTLRHGPGIDDPGWRLVLGKRLVQALSPTAIGTPGRACDRMCAPSGAACIYAPRRHSRHSQCLIS
jgi:hypothetical protein